MTSAKLLADICATGFAGTTISGQSQSRQSKLEEKKKRLLNIYEQKFAKIAAFQENTTVFQASTNAYMKNLETQVGQLALSM